MGSNFILLDFDNFFLGDDGEKDEVWVNSLINGLLRKILNYHSDFKDLHIRVYGGWIENGVFTPLASRLLQAIESRSFFPMPHPVSQGLLRGSLGLATSVLAVPELRWDNTLRRKRGLPRLRVDARETHAICDDNRDLCPVRILHKFSRRKNKECSVPGCGTINSDAFITVEQKMVDSMIICDLLELVCDETVSGIFVLSDDIDIHPGILAASAKRGILHLFHKNRQFSDDALETLERFGVIHEVWEE